MVGIVPISGTQQFDKDSSPPAFLVGGQLFVYLPTTTTPAPVFAEFALTTPLTFPIILDIAGRIPAIYGAMGSVRLRLLSSTGVVQFDEHNVALVAAAAGGGGGGVAAERLWNTGDLKVRYDDQPITGFVRANGRTIGSATSGSSELASSPPSLNNAHDLFVFLWPFANISLVGGPKGVAAETDWSDNRQLSLPDLAGRLIGARDDLGAGPRNRITAATVTGPTLAGAAGGVEVVTLDVTMIPAHAHPSPALTDPGHTHALSEGVYAAGALNPAAGAGGAALKSVTATNSVTDITIAPNTGSTGGGLSHNNMSPVMLFTVYIKL